MVLLARSAGLRAFAAVTFCVYFAVISGSSCFAQILVDDFTEVSDPGIYPFTRNYPLSGSLTDEPLTSTFGDARLLFLAAGPTIPLPNPIPSNLSLTVDVNPSLGILTSEASNESTTLLLLNWLNELAMPMNVDISAMSEFVIDYTLASDDYVVTVALINLQAGTATATAGNRGTFSLLSSPTGGQLRIDLDDISDPQPVPLQPGMFYPALDRTSLDAVLIQFETIELGASLYLEKVAFVPEPGMLVSLLAGLTILAFPRRR